MNNVNIKQCRRADYVSRLFKEKILLCVGQQSRRKKRRQHFQAQSRRAVCVFSV